MILYIYVDFEFILSLSEKISKREQEKLNSMSTPTHILTTSNRSYEVLSFESIELFLMNEKPSQFNSNLFLSACMFSSLLILINNGYLLYFLMKQLKKTFLDWMIVFDCTLCICNISTIIGE